VQASFSSTAPRSPPPSDGPIPMGLMFLSKRGGPNGLFLAGFLSGLVTTADGNAEVSRGNGCTHTRSSPSLIRSATERRLLTRRGKRPPDGHGRAREPGATLAGDRGARPAKRILLLLLLFAKMRSEFFNGSRRMCTNRMEILHAPYSSTKL
jgi:hypothetical protein